MKKRLLGSGILMGGLAAIALSYGPSIASDHDDGENADKERALNLTDHYVFRSPGDATKLTFVMYVNGRSLPGRQYYLATNARYEFHVDTITSKLDPAASANDVVFRFEAGAPNAAGVQAVELTVLKNMGGTLTEVESIMGNSTPFGASKANTGLTVNTTADVGGIDVKWFVGQRQDTFTFDVQRFFQVRNFLATRFFGKGATQGDATNAYLPPNCRGDGLLDEGTVADHDVVNLWNPPSCAPDFTKNYNVTAIVLEVPISQLGGTVFDTWSTVSVAK